MNIKKHPLFLLFVLILISLIVLIIAPFIGMKVINPVDITSGEIASHIFFTIRVPRVLTGFLAGSCLALCGMVFQAMFRNPLATPFTLGVSSGASFGAALVILTGFTGAVLGIPLSSMGAFCGAAAAMLLVYGFSSLQRTISNLTILLAGIAMSFLFSSLLMFVQFLSDLRHSFQIIRWLMGGLEVYGYRDLLSMLPLVLVGIIAIVIKLPELDLLLTGEDIAKTRGVNVKQTKKILFFATSLTVSAIVSVCGPIGFVGMMSPHICRLIFGNRHRILGPASFLFGGTFLVICDTVARTIIAPTEMPVGVLTSLFGGPFFLWILFSKITRDRGKAWL
ncbi:FecCD family ABC transporter permease [Fibrobacterota bacterium]